MSSPLLEKLPLQLFSFVIPSILFIIFLYKWIVVAFQPKLNLPPNPPRLPIIGNFHQLGKFPHRSLRSLSLKYGDYMLLYMGNRPTLVVSSATAAEHIMKTHDVIFANRAKLMVVNKIIYGGNDVVFNSYCKKWRQLKSICVTKILNNKRIQSFKPIREEEASRLIDEIASYNGSAINLSKTLFSHFKGLICRTALGQKYNDEGDIDFSKLFRELLEMIGQPNVGDYIPSLAWINKLCGLEGRAENLRKKFDDFVELVVKQHLNAYEALNEDEKKEKEDVKDFVDVLLEIQRENPEELTIENIKAVILDLFIAGTDTISTTLEWTMTELIRHPCIMEKVQEEVRSAIKANTGVREGDLENLKYLKAVIKETLRLHHPAPLLAIRESSQYVKIDKYDISAKTQVIVNAFAMQLDPKVWEDPEDFIPERFLNNGSSLDFTGQHLHYIPFGAGRRSCPGIAYGIVNTELILASLLYEFNWKLPNGREGDTLDVEETVGVVASRRNPLTVIATKTTPL